MELKLNNLLNYNLWLTRTIEIKKKINVGDGGGDKRET
jgi:hypothetical protein